MPLTIAPPPAEKQSPASLNWEYRERCDSLAQWAEKARVDIVKVLANLQESIPTNATELLRKPLNLTGARPRANWANEFLAAFCAPPIRHTRTTYADEVESAEVTAQNVLRKVLHPEVTNLTAYEGQWRDFSSEYEPHLISRDLAAISAVLFYSRFVEAALSFVVPTTLTAKFEHFYQKIGWWKGSNARPAVKEQVRSFWKTSGSIGITWLIHRVSAETHADILDGVANLLADIGPSIVEPIIRTLVTRSGYEHVDVLLKSLGWVEAPPHAMGISQATLAITLKDYLWHPEPDVRAAACAATRLLQTEVARSLLNQRRKVESNREVVEAIDQALKRDEGD
jgi:hypothetical protein